eukprot:218509-Pyramimonas_sp.AAC.1
MGGGSTLRAPRGAGGFKAACDWYACTNFCTRSLLPSRWQTQGRSVWFQLRVVRCPHVVENVRRTRPRASSTHNKW